MQIAGRAIGPGQPVYLVAEVGSNHGGSLDTAMKMVAVAAECGADAVKFQYFRAATMVPKNHPDYATFKANEIPNFWLPELRSASKAFGISVFFSVFDPADVAALERYDVPAYKIASAEMTYTALLEAVAATGKPVMLSTGMSTIHDCEEGINRLWQADDLFVLHCVSAYPAPPEQVNLSVLRQYGGLFKGLSDHTAEPFAAPLMAAALGASIIEKHFTLDRNQEGPDHAFAIEPAELKALATALHSAHLLLGDGNKRVMPSEMASLSDRRSAATGWLRGMSK